jgi:hypothetical protein
MSKLEEIIERHKRSTESAFISQETEDMGYLLAAIDNCNYIADYKADLTTEAGRWWAGQINRAIKAGMGED